MSFQQIASIFGESGCYFDSIITAGEEIAKKTIDRLRFYGRARNQGWMLANCYLESPDEILQDITDCPWTVRKESAAYKTKPGEIEILRFEWNNRPGSTLSHFVLGDGNGEVKYDPMGDQSPVVKYGVLASKRVFTEVNR